jgi:hypothetical protein
LEPEAPARIADPIFTKPVSAARDVLRKALVQIGGED